MLKENKLLHWYKSLGLSDTRPSVLMGFTNETEPLTKYIHSLKSQPPCHRLEVLDQLLKVPGMI